MPLPILNVRQEPSREDLVRLFHRTEAMWVGHLVEGVSLEAGTAYACAELGEIWDANHVRDAALQEGMTAGQAVAEVEGFFAERGTRCAYWVMNPSADEGRTRPLAEELLGRGYRVQVDDIYYLRKALPASAAAAVEGLRVIPARAAYRQSRALAAEKALEAGRGVEQVVEAYVRHLDDPHYDALLALTDDRPVALLGVLAVGELARIEGVYVSASVRGQGVGRMMMGRGLEICARALFKHVFLAVEPSNAAAARLYRAVGFEKVEEVVSYRKNQKPETRNPNQTTMTND